jgi:hypothetical protein
MQAFLAFNALALPIVFGTQQSDSVKLAISIVGFFTHTGLISAVLRSTSLLRYWDVSLARLEALDADSEQSTRIQIFNDSTFYPLREWKRYRFYLIPYMLTACVWAHQVIVIGDTVLHIKS